MDKNFIYYGPPGTGKTYMMQKKMNDFVDYDVTDQQILNAHVASNLGWVPIAMILFQNMERMTAAEIETKVSSLSLNLGSTVVSILQKHQINSKNILISQESPLVFVSYDDNKWYVDRYAIMQFDEDFFNKFMKSSVMHKRYKFVTFHQSFSYEDFIEGIRPSYDKATNTVDYSPKDGVFKQICDEAVAHPVKNYALFIDEINRGNISEIFGELITLIEPDKRKGAVGEVSVTLPYSKDLFSVPQNLFIYGSMNSADKSISLLDSALRRRFRFIPVFPDANVISNVLRSNNINPHNVDGVDLISLFTVINNRIEYLLDKNHLIGHSFFLGVRKASDIADVLSLNVIPLLEEYFDQNLSLIQMIFNDIDQDGKVRDDAIYKSSTLTAYDLFPSAADIDTGDKNHYFVSEDITVSALKHIYR